MTAKRARFRCIVLGEEGTLAARCGELLREAGHEILLMVTPTPAIRAWAQACGISVAAPDEHLAEVLRPLDFDHLFSIASWRLLEPAVLAMPRGFSINFHDLLLPAYAGANAPAWAIINGEREHGITWHLMADQVDAGDILAQRRFAVAADETTASLNAKCYEAAVAAFAELISKLEAGTLVAVPQAADTGSHYARYRKPAGGGVLDWRRSAVDLERQVRASHVGTHRNPFVLSKLVLGPNVWVVSLRRGGRRGRAGARNPDRHGCRQRGGCNREGTIAAHPLRGARRIGRAAHRSHSQAGSWRRQHSPGTGPRCAHPAGRPARAPRRP